MTCMDTIIRRIDAVRAEWNHVKLREQRLAAEARELEALAADERVLHGDRPCGLAGCGCVDDQMALFSDEEVLHRTPAGLEVMP